MVITCMHMWAAADRLHVQQSRFMIQCAGTHSPENQRTDFDLVILTCMPDIPCAPVLCVPRPCLWTLAAVASQMHCMRARKSFLFTTYWMYLLCGPCVEHRQHCAEPLIVNAVVMARRHRGPLMCVELHGASLTLCSSSTSKDFVLFRT